MESTSHFTNAPPECEIISKRILSFQRKLVFEAWTNPKHLKNWWGPKGFTNTFHAFDLKPGGKWSFIMHGPDKGNYPNECVFVRINPPELVSWNHISEPKFQVVAIFEELSASSTCIIFKMVFTTPEECNKIRTFAAEKNEENLDRLEVELRNMTIA